MTDIWKKTIPTSISSFHLVPGFLWQWGRDLFNWHTQWWVVDIKDYRLNGDCLIRTEYSDRSSNIWQLFMASPILDGAPYCNDTLVTTLSIGGSKGVLGIRALSPLGQISFIFMQFSAKSWQIIGFYRKLTGWYHHGKSWIRHCFLTLSDLGGLPPPPNPCKWKQLFFMDNLGFRYGCDNVRNHHKKFIGIFSSVRESVILLKW